MKFITIVDLKAKNACSEGIRWYKEQGYETLDWDSIDELEVKTEYNSYIHWLCENFKISLKYNGNEYKFDENNNEIYYENSTGFWVKREFDENNNKIYLENSTGFRSTWEFDKNNEQIYFENSYGLIIDNREEKK